MGVLEGYEESEVVVIRSEYFCYSCGQFRGSYFPIHKTKKCKNCGSSGIVVTAPGKLDHKKFKQLFLKNK